MPSCLHLRLLKLNGCISRPSDVVLTREDFVSSEHQRSVLATIVQVLVFVSILVKSSKLSETDSALLWCDRLC